MAIIQGSNQPIIITFDSDITDIRDLHVAIFDCNHATLKDYTKDDITIEGNEAVCPLTQEETLGFKRGNCTIEIKWMDDERDVYLARIIHDNIVYRDDKHIIGGESNV